MNDVLKDVTILYVEDEKDIRETYIDFFGMFVKKILFAEDGEMGLMLFKEHQDDIDLVISDIKMPKLDGINMVQEIKAIRADVPVIFTTAFSDSSYLMEAIKLKADDYILKPIDLKALLLSMEKIILPKIQQQKLQEQERLLFLQNRLASMGEMLGNIAHQWKQPLSAMSMQIENIKLDLLPDPKYDVVFDDINEQIQYMSSTVRDFIEFLQPNRYKREFETSSMIQKAILLFRSDIKKYSIKIEFENIEEVKAFGKKNEFMQVIVNIIKNAKDLLVAKNIENPQILITQKLVDNMIHISVQDNAGGIDDAIISKVFDKNFSSHSTKDSSGLGLYMSKQIISDMGGVMNITNIDNFGKGVEFVIILPQGDKR